MEAAPSQTGRPVVCVSQSPATATTTDVSGDVLGFVTVTDPFVDRLRRLRIETSERDAEIRRDPERYWALAAEALVWARPWRTVFTQDPARPWEFAYFAGGRINACENALDRHLAAGAGDRPALLWEGDPAAYRRLGLGAGDRIVLYLPNMPETTVAMLAAAR